MRNRAASGRAGRGRVGILLACWLAGCGGCAKLQMLPYLDQVMVLQDLSDDKAAQDKMVARIDADFERMLAAIKDGRMARYRTQRQVIGAFGPPIISEQEVVEGKIYEQALYRYAIQGKSPQKVHIFYDRQGNVARYEVLP